jgi:formylglycine-generating enzyme required for sulfatase activity
LPPLRIFISYSQDSDQHKERVGQLADRLVGLGFDCHLDQYEVAPAQGWLRWMEEQIAAADFVLVISTEGYLKKALGQFQGSGLGARKESDSILADLYQKGGMNNRFIPVCLDAADRPFIHPTLEVYTFHIVATTTGFEGLLRHLQRKPARVKPTLGSAVQTPQPTEVLNAGDRRVDEMTGIELVWVPGGRYRQGGEAFDDEKPIHSVELTGFWIGRFPVTNRQYWRFLRATAARKPEWIDSKDFGADDQPIVGVEWHEATAFCTWAGLALPTEAQWEAAARGNDLREYPWGPEAPSPKLANFDASKISRTTAVGAYPNAVGPFGTLDQAGNVWEWCRDAWDGDGYQNRALKDPCREGASDAYRVLRGGSWADRAGHLRAAFRGRGVPSVRVQYFGFRVVLVSAPEP